MGNGVGTERKKVRRFIRSWWKSDPRTRREERRSLGGCTLDSWVVQLSLNIQATYSQKESALWLHPLALNHLGNVVWYQHNDGFLKVTAGPLDLLQSGTGARTLVFLKPLLDSYRIFLVETGLFSITNQASKSVTWNPHVKSYALMYGIITIAKKEAQPVSSSYPANSKKRQTKMWKEVNRKPQIFCQNASATQS